MAEIWTMGEMIVEIMRRKKMSHWIKQEFFEESYPSGSTGDFY